MKTLRVDGEEIRYWRHKRVMSRQQLAQEAGVGRSTLANLESGWKETARPETVRAIAKALKVSPEKLVVVRKESAA
jgi:transcriptional regulator with XRE-family HTH domain